MASRAEAASGGGEPGATLRPPLIVEPTAEHTHSVIMLHGMYNTGDMFRWLPQILAALGGRPEVVRFIFPCAPVRTIDWPAGREEGVSAWFNYFSCNSGTMELDRYDRAQLAQVTRQLHALIDGEVARLVLLAAA